MMRNNGTKSRGALAATHREPIYELDRMQSSVTSSHSTACNDALLSHENHSSNKASIISLLALIKKPIYMFNMFNAIFHRITWTK